MAVFIVHTHPANASFGASGMFGSEQYTKKVGNVCAHAPQDWKKLDPEILEPGKHFSTRGGTTWEDLSDNAVRFQSTLFCIIIPYDGFKNKQ